MNTRSSLRQLFFRVLLIALIMPIFAFVYNAGYSAPVRFAIVFASGLVIYAILKRFGLENNPTS